MTEPSCFLVIEGREGTEERRLPLGVESVVVGRDEGADVEIDDPKLSRRHAAFRVIDGHPYVEDLGSINGVKVRGRRIEERRRLRDGDRLRLGNTLIRVLASGLPPPTTSLGPRLLGPEQELSLTREVRVGRASDCQLRLEDPSVSRLHARIEPEPPTVYDEGSAQGVFVNDVRVRSSRLLDGDELRFGQVGFEIEIPMGTEGPREQVRWRAPWPRWVLAAAALVLMSGAVVYGLGSKTNGEGRDGPGIDRDRRAGPPAPLQTDQDELLGPVLGPEVDGSPDAPSSDDVQVFAPGLGEETPQASESRPSGPKPYRTKRRPRTQPAQAETESLTAPPSWHPGLRHYFEGDLEAAKRRSKDPELEAWLAEAEARHARALTEVSNDVQRAKALLEALARTEAEVSTMTSPMRRDLRVLLAAAFAERGERLLEQSRGGDAFRHLVEAQALAAHHPRVRVLAQRLDEAARARSLQATEWARSGDQRACKAWRDVAEMTPARRALARLAAFNVDRLCQ